jgi:two-component system LytT family response regulator
MIRCVIIDDEQYAINVLVEYVKRTPTLELAGTFTNPVEGLAFIGSQAVDLVFLDIQMDEMNGFEVMKILPKHVHVIFCTAFSEFAVASYDVDAIDYLLKPVSFPRFMKAIQRVTSIMIGKVVEEISSPVDDYIFVKTEQKGKMLKINLHDIDYVEGMGNYVAFHCGKQKILANLTLKELEQRLPRSQYLRVHKSFIVALRLITSIDNSLLALKGREERIPLSDSYKDIFLEYMKDKMMH